MPADLDDDDGDEVLMATAAVDVVDSEVAAVDTPVPLRKMGIPRSTTSALRLPAP